MEWWSIDAFKKLTTDKQMRILNAAYDEFAEQRYEKASTNKIVKAAKISKGMLFYYFKSKQNLFNYLIEYGINYIQKYYLDLIDDNESDFIERYRQFAEIKLKAYRANPHIFNFFGSFYINKEIVFPEKPSRKLLALKEFAYRKLYENVDLTLFKTSIDHEMAITLIRWIFVGYENEMIQKLQAVNLVNYDYSSLFAEYYEYLDLLKTLFYK